MKTQRRHELATNDLADWLGGKIEAVKPYTTAILATVLAVLVVLFAYTYFSRQSARESAEAWSVYLDALDQSRRSAKMDPLEQVAEQYAATEAGLWARLTLADAQLAQGIEELFSDRVAANKSLDSAVRNYLEVRRQTVDRTLLAERATLGLAQAYESQNELHKARNEYEALKKNWPNGTFAAEADRRLADLNKPATKQFYDWFDRQEPKPSPPPGPGIPGETPDFELGDVLEDEHPFGSRLELDEAQAPDEERDTGDGE